MALALRSSVLLAGLGAACAAAAPVGSTPTGNGAAPVAGAPGANSGGGAAAGAAGSPAPTVSTASAGGAAASAAAVPSVAAASPAASASAGERGGPDAEGAPLAEVWGPCCPHEPCCHQLSPVPLRSRGLHVEDPGRHPALHGALTGRGQEFGQCFSRLHGLDSGWPRSAVTLHLKVSTEGTVRLALVVAGLRPDGFEDCLREAVAAVRLGPAPHPTSARWELTFGE